MVAFLGGLTSSAPRPFYAISALEVQQATAKKKGRQLPAYISLCEIKAIMSRASSPLI